jgi:flavin reductase (DIM6/NTAB) family NADH-FMN oxidoreductase RutF
MLLVCMNRASATGGAIERCGHFSVNILGEGQADVAARFARAGGDFAGLAVDAGPRGEPILSEALATIGCRVVERARGGTHTVFIGEADRAEARSDGAPLAYFRGRFNRLGPLGSGAA